MLLQSARAHAHSLSQAHISVCGIWGSIYEISISLVFGLFLQWWLTIQVFLSATTTNSLRKFVLQCSNVHDSLGWQSG